MSATARRRQLREILNGPDCLSPAAVYDPMSARIAEAAGFRVGLFSGKIASATLVAAPDLNVITLTELVEQARRITRASGLALIVDADHGYGNALNAMRTVEELEYAGASMISLEDTALPPRYADPQGHAELVSLEEMADKVRAAIRARQDPALMIAARTAALASEGTEGTVARAKAYSAAGADAIFLMHVTSLDELDAVHGATRLPIVVALVPSTLDRKAMAARGVRVVALGHHPALAAARALQHAYEHLYRGGSPDELEPRLMSAADLNTLVRGDAYAELQREYLRAKPR